MTAKKIRVFVSSVSVGLQEIRDQIIQDLSKAGYDVTAMERFGAQPSVPLDVCLRELRKSDAVVLVIGPRYGSVLPQGVSYTQAEFREARAIGLHVFAFRISDDPTIGADERAQLDAFATEVGSTSTYDSLPPHEKLERLSALVLAALSTARERGDIGQKFAVFQKYDRYFAPQLIETTTLFDHGGPFVGRESQLAEMQSFVTGDGSVLLLKAPGGSGKSRLLLEVAKWAAQQPDAPQLFFMNPSATWSADDINRLPRTSSAIVVFDDGHRRPDLDRVIAACRQHNDGIRYVVSCRPSAVAIVTPLLSPLLGVEGLPEIDLPRLSQEDAHALARHYLGDAFGVLAERLVAVADRNPLVVRVGGRCIAENRVVPEALERTPEAFRRVVLERLLDDPALKSSNATANRQVLEVLSAIGPVVIESDEFVKQLARITQLNDDEVRRFLAILERERFLSRRGRVVRVSPDVLADHLLYQAAVDDNSQPTGFVDRMVEQFGSALENILANAAELDWRSENVSGPNSVLRRVWRDLIERLPVLTNRARAELVGQLKRAAIFAPAEVLRICEWLVDHPEAPKDELLEQWGLVDSRDRLTDSITELLGLIATHPDFTTRCASMLWSLGDNDQRPENPNPNHPRRQLADLLKYEPRTGWRAPDGSHAKTVGFLVERLRATDRDHSSAWAVKALGVALRRTGEDNQQSKRVFTIREFSLAPFASELASRRGAVLDSLVDIALGSKLDEAATALSEMSTTLSGPRGPLGRGLAAEEIALWEAEAQRVIKNLKTIAETAPTDIVRFLARRELRSFRQDYWPEIAPAVQGALKDVAPAQSEPLYDLLIGVPWEEQLDDWRQEEARVEQLSTDAARRFWEAHNDPSSAVDTLLAAISAFSGLGRETESRTGQLVRALVLTCPHDRRKMIQELATRNAPWPLLRSALLALHEIDATLAEVEVHRLSASEHPLVRASVADSMQWMMERPANLRALVDTTRKLAQDSSPMVRAASARVARRLAKIDPREALSILVTIDWAGEAHVAGEVFRSIDAKYGVDPSQLSESDIDGLLGRIEVIRSLDSRNYEVLEFINIASRRRPAQTVAMLLHRVLVTDRHLADQADRWDPLPHNAHGLSVPGVENAPDHLDLARVVRNAMPGAESLVRFWLPTLYCVVDPKLAAARTVFREWLRSGESEKILATATLLRGFDHSVVFHEHELIADIVSAAAQCGSECLDYATGELIAVAASGVYSSAPGQPAPRHVQDRKDAMTLAEQYATNEPVRAFYAAVALRAESSMRMDVELWDEGDDE